MSGNAREPGADDAGDDTDAAADDTGHTDDTAEAVVDPGDGDADDGDAAPGREPRDVYRLVGWSILGLVLLGVVWIVVTGVIARSQLNDARDDIRTLRAAVVSGDTERAARLVSQIRDKTDTAHDLTTGPAWWIGANLPGIGTPLRTGRVIAAQADRLGNQVLPGVLRLARTVPTRSSNSVAAIDLDDIAKAAPELHRAAETARDAADTVAATPSSWLPTVSNAHDAVVAELGRLAGELDGADHAVRVALPMLGENGRQRYFVGFLNEAEARGGGGIPGAFAIVTADHGRIAFERFGTDDDLKRVRADVNLPADLKARYAGSDILGTFQNSNLSPDFGVAGRIWAASWEAKTGEKVDGAIALDPTALSYLLRVTGPAAVSGTGVSTVSADTVVALTQQKQYSLYPGRSRTATSERKRFLVGLARAISTKLTVAKQPAQLVKAFSRAAAQRRLVVWSARPRLERLIREADWAGALGNPQRTPYSGWIVNNAAGSKLDYYLRRRVTYRRDDCDAGGVSTASITLTNAAPRRGLPAYVTIRADEHAAPDARPGDNKVLLTYYASRNAVIDTLTVDDRPVPFALQPEGDTVAVTIGLELKVGVPTTVVATVREPAAAGPAQILAQPGVKPLAVDVRGDLCR